MDTLLYLLFGPIGCMVGMVVWMAMLARRRRRADAKPAPADEVAGLRPELQAQRSEAGND